MDDINLMIIHKTLLLSSLCCSHFLSPDVSLSWSTTINQHGCHGKFSWWFTTRCSNGRAIVLNWLFTTFVSKVHVVSRWLVLAGGFISHFYPFSFSTIHICTNALQPGKGCLCSWCTRLIVYSYRIDCRWHTSCHLFNWWILARLSARGTYSVLLLATYSMIRMPSFHHCIF